MYGGTILRVDLAKGEVYKELTASYSGDFLGARGINIKLLYDEVPPEIAALNPSNPLIFSAGPLSGTPVPASRTEVTAKSPETGFLGTADFGGSFGPELKFAGYDNIAITGRTDKPVYLVLLDIKLRGMSGIKLYQFMEKMPQNLTKRAVFITGDVTGPGTQRFFSETKAPCISKPFNVEQLKKDIVCSAGNYRVLSHSRLVRGNL